MNSLQVTTVLLATLGLFATTANAQGGWPAPPGGLFPPNIFNCQPIDRLFVIQGGICFQQNSVMQNCLNQTCRCSAIQTPSFPSPPSLFPFPFPIPTLPPINLWNCTTGSSSN
ncbi:unnamed protein product [Orchesella dallaii]|uniref:Uncharacterized protein n=1 Tax=Orchesella dallaii TaxID=48710 RepID=A0ABP1QJB4_9HEXA